MRLDVTAGDWIPIDLPVGSSKFRLQNESGSEVFYWKSAEKPESFFADCFTIGRRVFHDDEVGAGITAWLRSTGVNGRVIILPDVNISGAPTVETIGSATSTVASGGGTLAGVAGVPVGAVLEVADDTGVILTQNPTDTLSDPIAFTGALTATLTGIAALATFPITFFLS